MRKEMTPCEKLGYKVGDKFKASKSGSWFNVGEEVELGMDDGSNYPYFFNARMPKDSDGGRPLHIESVEKISNAKLKPAKQALADAIHQNGGWRGGCYAVFGKVGGRCIFCDEKPYFSRDANCWYVHADKVVGAFSMKPFVNWHQCILSRDAYFTAYPEQVKVEVKNETKHKVEVEMKSESEMTIKVSDWHKNGDLPPVGEVCEWLECKQTGWQEVIVAGYYMNSAWIVPKGKEPITVFNPTGFRALRTEREKAIDEMVGVARDIGYSSNNSIAIIGDVASAMYDLGYRKEAK